VHGIFERGEILRSRHLDCPELLKVRSHPLDVEQREPPLTQPLDQKHQCHFRRVAHAVKHRLAEERAPQAHPIQPPGETVFLPDLH
jgi:hypothetical protein